MMLQRPLLPSAAGGGCAWAASGGAAAGGVCTTGDAATWENCSVSSPYLRVAQWQLDRVFSVCEVLHAIDLRLMHMEYNTC